MWSVPSRRLLTVVISGAAAAAVIAGGATWAIVGAASAREEAASIEQYAAAVTGYATANADRNAALSALVRDRRDVLALNATGAALVAAAQPQLLADPAARDAVTASLAGLLAAAGLAADGGIAADADGRVALPPPVPLAPHWTLFFPAPGDRDTRDTAAAPLTAALPDVVSEQKSLDAARRGIADARESAGDAMLALATSAHTKGSATAPPEKASQESKDAYTAAVAALAKPATGAQVLTLVTAYQDAWAAAIASDEANRAAERARAADSVVPTYIRGILVVNKTYGLPRGYGNGLTGETLGAFNAMQSEAASHGLNLYISSGFRSYATQAAIYNRLVAEGGVAYADRDTARPGHSEHQ